MHKSSNCFAKCKTKQEVIECYVNHIQALENVAKQTRAIPSTEFQRYLQRPHKCKQFKASEQPCERRENGINCTDKSGSLFSRTSLLNFAEFVLHAGQNKLRKYRVCIVIIFIVFVLVNYKLEASNLFMRNIQSFIYPGMRAWRKLTLPIIETFPQLADLYDETCLIENPLFQVAALDCSPCANVVNVMDFSMSKYLAYYDHSVPHIVQTETTPLHTMSRLHSLYTENRKVFHENAYKVHSTDRSIRNLDQMFDLILNDTRLHKSDTHISWRINRMAPARVLRTIFPTPKNLPAHVGIGVERYITIDTPNSPSYPLPTTDCSNMFVYQAIGSRTIYLQPTKECQTQCRRISVRLTENFILFYDWWYWKPVSSPDSFPKSVSMSYIGSYC